MERNNSDNWMIGGGTPLSSSPHEMAPTIVIDRCLSNHDLRMALEKARDVTAPNSDQSSPLLPHKEGIRPLPFEKRQPMVPSYGSEAWDVGGTIRFQVVVWYVGDVDVVQGRVPMKFRITLFWNAVEDIESNYVDGFAPRRKKHTIWAMQGRQKAYRRVLSETEMPISMVDVPPVSILNAVTFDVIGQPEVSLLREDTRLMRWTCMYRATLVMDDMTVENFPHDRHNLRLKLGVLAHRRTGGRWDRNRWKLALATEEDSQSSTRIPYGVIVDHVKIPGFNYEKESGNGCGLLKFELAPLSFGLSDEKGLGDRCVEVKLAVLRDSGYYDYNIMPLLGLLNVVAISCLFLNSSQFFQRGLLMLNIAFVEIGIRMTVDKHLPSVGYQIKMQSILNELFCALLFLVLESMLVYILFVKKGWSVEATDRLDHVASLVASTHLMVRILLYYWDMYSASRKLNLGAKRNANSCLCLLAFLCVFTFLVVLIVLRFF